MQRNSPTNSHTAEAGHLRDTRTITSDTHTDRLPGLRRNTQMHTGDADIHSGVTLRHTDRAALSHPPRTAHSDGVSPSCTSLWLWTMHAGSGWPQSLPGGGTLGKTVNLSGPHFFFLFVGWGGSFLHPYGVDDVSNACFTESLGGSHEEKHAEHLGPRLALFSAHRRGRHTCLERVVRPASGTCGRTQGGSTVMRSGPLKCQEIAVA